MNELMNYHHQPAKQKITSTINSLSFQQLTVIQFPFVLGCLHSVEWNGGMEYWNGILEYWNGIATCTELFFFMCLMSVSSAAV